MRVTRFRDPDTGELLGTDRDVGRLSQTTRLGSMFTQPETAAPVAEPPRPRSTTPSPDEVDLADTRARVRDLARIAKQAPDGNDRARAARELGALRDAEYARPDGGRLLIKRALNPAGYGRPEPVPAQPAAED